MPDRDLLAPAFPDDDGSPDAGLRAALAAYDADDDDAHRYAAVLSGLSSARILVPVVAVLGESETIPTGPAAGLTSDKSSDMAAVLLQRPDGRRALLGFTGTDALTAWDPQARPVPVTAKTAALAAVQEGADALLVDAAGPVRFVVEGDHLRALAAGWRLVPAEEGPEPTLVWVADSPPEGMLP